MSTDDLARELVSCYQRRYWLEGELEAVNLRANEIVGQIHAIPYEPAGLQLRVPGYVSADTTARMVRPVECPPECYVPFRHIHTADGAVHEVDLRLG